MSGWQPQRYDPQPHQQRMHGTAPQPAPDRSWAHGPQPQQSPPWADHQAPRQTYGQYAQQQITYPQHTATPRKKRRVFMWVFIAIQVLFIIWIITGVASHPAGPTASAQAAQQCANGGWQGLFKSQADCQVHYAHALNDAADTGKGLGVALIVVFWCVVDFLLGITYLIIRLARRPARA